MRESKFSIQISRAHRLISRWLNQLWTMQLTFSNLNREFFESTNRFPDNLKSLRPSNRFAYWIFSRDRLLQKVFELNDSAAFWNNIPPCKICNDVHIPAQFQLNTDQIQRHQSKLSCEIRSHRYFWSIDATLDFSNSEHRSLGFLKYFRGFLSVEDHSIRKLYLKILEGSLRPHRLQMHRRNLQAVQD